MSETPTRVPWTHQQKIFLWVIIFLVIAIAGFFIGAAASAASTPKPQTGAPDTASVHAYEVKQLEGSIKRSVQNVVDKGLLAGPILSVTCIPDGTGNAQSTSYTCLAANKKNSDGTETGLTFTGVINWDSGQYVWRLAR